MAAAGYPTVLEGVVGPWMLDLVRAEADAHGVPVHYVVLRPDLPAVVQRAAARAGDERVPGHPALSDEEVIRTMWHQFADLGDYERFVVDTSAYDAQQTADLVWSHVTSGDARLP